MFSLAIKLLDDEAGAIVSAEFIIIATVVVLALVTGWNAVSGALVGELTDVASAFGAMNQSFSYRGVSAISQNGAHATCSGSGFVDVGNTIVLDTTNQVIAGGLNTTGFSSTGSFQMNSGSGQVNSSSTAQSSASAAQGLAAANVVEGVDVAEERLDAVAVETGEVLSARVVAETPVQVLESPRVRASAVNPSSDCELLKKKIRELCLELESIESASQSSGSLQPKPASNLPAQRDNPPKSAQ